MPMKYFLGIVLSAFVIFFVEAGYASKTAPRYGELLASQKFRVPEDAKMRDYLGLVGIKGFFTIPQVKADVVIIYIFSMYCPYCQKDVPNVKEVYRLIQSRPDLYGKFKILGIGVGNSPYEVKLYKNKYELPFPLFDDKTYSLYYSLKGIRTPCFVVLYLTHGGFKVIYSKPGTMNNALRFLDEILASPLLKKKSGQ